MAAVGGKYPFGIGLLRRAAGDPIGDFTGVLPAFFIGVLPLDDKGLSDVRKIQIAIELGGCPDFADFNPPVIRRIAKGKIGLLAIFEIQGDVLIKSWLVIFYGEMVVGLAFTNDILGDLALGQQSISCNVFAFNIDGIKQRDGSIDFVGTLKLFTALYR
jgi:hypothetical protein